MKIVSYWLPVFVWAGIIFALSSLRVTPSSQIYWQDFVVKKFAHLVEYAVLFLLLYRAIRNATPLSAKVSAILAFVLAVLYGVSDEFHQSFTPGREPKVRDVLIDASGSGIAWIVLWKYLPKMPERLKALAKNLQID